MSRDDTPNSVIVRLMLPAKTHDQKRAGHQERLRLTDAALERKRPSLRSTRFGELRLGKREGRKEILSYFASFATSAFDRD
jgi:hypothetical protein